MSQRKFSTVLLKTKQKKSDLEKLRMKKMLRYNMTLFGRTYEDIDLLAQANA